jgi:dihydrofolate reductase
VSSALWPKTRFVRSREDISALKKQPGKDIYLMGGARITASFIDAGLVGYFARNGAIRNDRTSS